MNLYWWITILAQDGIISSEIPTFAVVGVTYERCRPMARMKSSQTEFSRTFDILIFVYFDEPFLEMHVC
jgi:hypothetical protein